MTESHDDVIRQPTGSGFEYTFRCALGQGVDNYAAAGKLHCDLMREFQTRTRDVVELAFTRSCAVLRTRHEGDTTTALRVENVVYRAPAQMGDEP